MEALAVQKKRERQAAQEKLQKQKAFEAEERKKKAAEVIIFVFFKQLYMDALNKFNKILSDL